MSTLLSIKCDLAARQKYFQQEKDYMLDKYKSLFNSYPDALTDVINNTFFYDERIFRETKDTLYHCLNVSFITGCFAKKLGYGENEIRELKIASFLHDIGKLAIDPKVLNKNGKLTEEERKHMNCHPSLGRSIMYDILMNSDLFEDLNGNLRVLEDLILFHHTYDAEKIEYFKQYCCVAPTHVKMIRIIDDFSALADDRCYKDAMPLDEVFDKIRQKFPPRMSIVESFIEMCSNDPSSYMRYLRKEDPYLNYETLLKTNEVNNENDIECA